MHAVGCWRKQCGSDHYTFKLGTAGCECNEFMQLGCVGGFDFTPMASQLLGVSMRASHNTTQVMLGVSLRARCDTTLVIIITRRSTEAGS